MSIVSDLISNINSDTAYRVSVNVLTIAEEAKFWPCKKAVFLTILTQGSV